MSSVSHPLGEVPDVSVACLSSARLSRWLCCIRWLCSGAPWAPVLLERFRSPSSLPRFPSMFCFKIGFQIGYIPSCVGLFKFKIGICVLSGFPSMVWIFSFLGYGSRGVELWLPNKVAETSWLANTPNSQLTFPCHPEARETSTALLFNMWLFAWQWFKFLLALCWGGGANRTGASGHSLQIL